nr:small nuclear ribonucleoprotein-associated protein B'-like [Penaeus vannamei]
MVALVPAAGDGQEPPQDHSMSHLPSLITTAGQGAGGPGRRGMTQRDGFSGAVWGGGAGAAGAGRRESVTRAGISLQPSWSATAAAAAATAATAWTPTNHRTPTRRRPSPPSTTISPPR